MTNAIIIGLAPAHECQINQHCMGQFMRTVCQISGLRYENYLKVFGRLNLFPDPVGKSVMPPLVECQERGITLVGQLLLYFNKRPRSTVRLICAGTVTYSAIRAAVLELAPLTSGRVDILVDFIPHPSGRNRMLNNLEVRTQMAEKICHAYAQSTALPQDFYHAINRLANPTLADATVFSQPVDERGPGGRVE